MDIHYRWTGIDYQFIDRKYQKRWRAMRIKLAELLDLLLEKSSNKGMNFYHMLPPKDKRSQYPDLDQRMKNAETANTLWQKPASASRKVGISIIMTLVLTDKLLIPC